MYRRYKDKQRTRRWDRSGRRDWIRNPNWVCCRDGSLPLGYISSSDWSFLRPNGERILRVGRGFVLLGRDLRSGSLPGRGNGEFFFFVFIGRSWISVGEKIHQRKYAGEGSSNDSLSKQELTLIRLFLGMQCRIQHRLDRFFNHVCVGNFSKNFRFHVICLLVLQIPCEWSYLFSFALKNF